jgi:hypothetical protein
LSKLLPFTGPSVSRQYLLNAADFGRGGLPRERERRDFFNTL